MVEIDSQLLFSEYIDQLKEIKTSIWDAELNKSEQKLKESEELFRNIAENTFIGFSIIQDNKIIYANEALSNINGYTIEEMKNWEPHEYIEMIHPDYREGIINQLRKHQEENDESVTFTEFPFYSKKG